MLGDLITEVATLDPKDINGNTPLHLAVLSNRLDCVLLLLRAGMHTHLFIIVQ